MKNADNPLVQAMGSRGQEAQTPGFNSQSFLSFLEKFVDDRIRLSQDTKKEEVPMVRTEISPAP